MDKNKLLRVLRLLIALGGLSCIIANIVLHPVHNYLLSIGLLLNTASLLLVRACNRSRENDNSAPDLPPA